MIAVVLEKDPIYGRVGDHTRICVLDRSDGSIRFQSKVGDGDRLSALAPAGGGDPLLAGILNSSRFLLFSESENQGHVRLVEERLSMADLIDGAEEVMMLDARGRLQRLEKPYADLGGFAGDEVKSESAALEREYQESLYHDIWISDSPARPWLITEPDRLDRSLLFTGFAESRFRKVYLLDGAFSHHFCIPDSEQLANSSCMWIWDSVGNLYCFESDTGDFLWKSEVGDISDFPPVISDLDGNGSPEGLLTTLSGGIIALDLASGARVLDIKRKGAAYTFVLPVNTDEDQAQELWVGLTEGGGFVLDGGGASGTPAEQDLYKALAAMGEWRNPKQDS
jgi:hypothetical protein